jgi:uncharacterized membrane protein (Fun14 family)
MSDYGSTSYWIEKCTTKAIAFVDKIDYMQSIESFGSMAATLGGGFFVGVLIGYSLKKVIKLVAVIVGLFLAGLAYLQYHQVANINWNKLQTIAEGTIITLSNVVMKIPGTSITSIDGHAAATASLAMTSFGIPLAGSMSAGFTLGFIKG